MSGLVERLRDGIPSQSCDGDSVTFVRCGRGDCACERQLRISAAIEIARLRAAERKAFTAGFWVFCGPSNDAEHDALNKQEQEAWDEYIRSNDDGTKTQSQPEPTSNGIAP